MCMGKRKYANEEEAKSAIRRMRAMGTPYNLNAYLCPYCQMWHIGGTHQSDDVTREFDGEVYTKKSMQKTHDDAHWYKEYLEKRGWVVKVLPPNCRRKRWHIYARKVETKGELTDTP